MQATFRFGRGAGAILALLIWVAGCSAPASDLSTPSGIQSRIDLSRATVALQRVNASANVNARIVVEPNDRPTACSWADGTICVSRGFVRRTSDEELAAVVAHELGHLCLARDKVAPDVQFGFRGDGSLLVECQADEVGVLLLKQSGLSADALARALAIVRDDALTSAETKQALNMRIGLLQKAD